MRRPLLLRAARRVAWTALATLLPAAGLWMILSAPSAAAPSHSSAPKTAAAAPVAADRAAGSGGAPAGAVKARTFTIRYRNPGDVALLVQPLLSPVGAYTLQPALKTLTVQDSEAVLSRVADVVASFDVPPRNVEVTINLLLGSQDRKENQPLSREVRGITDVLPDITKWKNLRLIDSVSITASEGARTTRTLGEAGGAYQIEMGIQSVDDEHGVIRIEPFIVSKENPAAGADAAGAVRWNQEYASKLNLHQGVALTVVAARSTRAERALFLTIRARVLK